MRIVISSDFHGKISIIDQIIKEFKELSPNIITFCGDAVRGKARGTAWLKAQSEGKRPDFHTPDISEEAADDDQAYRAFFSSLDSIGVPVMVIPGNMDAPESRFFMHLFNFELTLENIMLIQENILYYEGLFFGGFGGEITDEQSEADFVLQYPIQKVRFSLRKLAYVQGRKVLVLHTPPRSKLDFEKGIHKGYACVNDLIEWLKPDFVFCGHAHNALGEEWLGKSLVINPGALKEGCFAILDTEVPCVQFKSFNLHTKNVKS